MLVKRYSQKIRIDKKIHGQFRPINYKAIITGHMLVKRRGGYLDADTPHTDMLTPGNPSITKQQQLVICPQSSVSKYRCSDLYLVMRADS